MKHIIITLPAYLWEKIVKKEKRIELRSSFPRSFSFENSKCYVVRKGTHDVLGYFKITEISDYKPNGCIPIGLANLLKVPFKWLVIYCRKNKKLYFWHIGEVHEFPESIDARQVFGISTNPQSFIYTDISPISQ